MALPVGVANDFNDLNVRAADECTAKRRTGEVRGLLSSRRDLAMSLKAMTAPSRKAPLPLSRQRDFLGRELINLSKFIP